MNIDDVFSPSFGNRPSQLVGREGVIREFLRGLESKPGNKDRAVVMLGQRGSGKTVLLWELADRARKMDFAVATPTVTTNGMLERIVEKIQDDGEKYVRERRLHVSGGSVGALGFSAGLQFTRDVQESKSFQYKLTQLCRVLSERNKGVLILVDELQANSDDVRQLVVAYQEIVGEGLNVALVMAGLPNAVAATLNDHVLTFLNRARKVELGPLATNEVDAYFAEAFPQLGIDVTDDIRRKAAIATQGSPYLLQLLGHNMALYAGPSKRVDEKAFANALAAAQNDFENDICKTTLAALSEKDVLFLRAMAADAGPSKMSDIAARMCVKPDYAQKYRLRLIDAGVIGKASRGYVEFAIPYLAEHLRRD